ncbi:MAG TPA: hypothetical protein DIW23_10435 [Anaerolineae bacterium]|nr:hypothetical protein [Anaerolineae bacterium]
MADKEKNSEVSELAKYLKASLLLQIRTLAEDESKKEKIEFILYRSGFSRNEIADLLNKKYETVKKTLQTLKINNGNLKTEKDGE